MTRELDLPASIPAVTKEVVAWLRGTLHELSGLSACYLFGDMTHNLFVNRTLKRNGPFDRIWIQPAAGAAGSSLDAAYMGIHAYFNVTSSSRHGDCHFK